MSSFSSTGHLCLLAMTAIHLRALAGAFLGDDLLRFVDRLICLGRYILLVAFVYLLLSPPRENFEDSYQRPTLVVGFDNSPGCICGFRPRQHFIHCRQPLIVIAMLSAVILGDPPCLIGIGKIFLKALLLLLLRNVHPELEEQLTIVGEPTFKLVDLLAGDKPLRLLDYVVKAISEDLAIPTVLEYRHISIVRQNELITMQKVIASLEWSWWGVGVHSKQS